MADRAAPAIATIPAHRAFSDALAAGILARHGRDPMVLARGILLLPNNRSIRAVGEAFVRRSGGGLLMPRLVAVGDEERALSERSTATVLRRGAQIKRDLAMKYAPQSREV